MYPWAGGGATVQTGARFGASTSAHAADLDSVVDELRDHLRRAWEDGCSLKLKKE